MVRFVFIALVFLTALAGEVRGHAITALSVVSDFTSDGGYRLKLGIDVKLVRDDEDPGGVTVADPNAPLTAEEIEAVEGQVEEYIATSLRFYFGEERFEPAFEISESGAAETEGASADAAEGVGDNAPMRRYGADASGTVPEGTKEFLLEATPEAVAPVIFIIFRDGKPTRHSQVLYSGEFSRPVDLEAIRSGEALPGRRPQVPPEKKEVIDETEEEIVVERVEVPEGRAGKVFQIGLAEGARQFVPAGWNHAFFVVGFLILSWGFGVVFRQVLAFTIAHSVALALGALGIIVPSPVIVEAVVALSVACIAVDNLVHEEVGRWRVGLVFVLGLAHGLGFAEAFGREVWAEGSLVPGLVGFNLGIEVGQLSLILVAAAALSWMRGREKYRAFVVVPGSIVLALAGIFGAVRAIKLGLNF